MCNLIVTLCPTCSKEAAQSPVKKCASRANPLSVIPCTTSEIKIFAKNPCILCINRRQAPSDPTKLVTRDILEEMSFKIPEWPSTSLSRDPIFPRWTFESLTAIQTKELFFDHITRHHSVEVKNRQGLPSQREGIPLCLVAGVAGRNRKPARVFQRPPRFASPGISRPDGRDRATIALPPSAWNNRRQIRRLGIAPTPRAQSLHESQPPVRTPTCLVPEGIRRRSQFHHRDCIVSPLAPCKQLKIETPAGASASARPQATTDSTPSSVTSAHSEHLTPGPSPQVQTFSPVAFAQIPSHFDLRPLRVPTPQQRVQERERRETLNRLQERVRQRQERDRQHLETQRIRDLRQRDEGPRFHSNIAPPRTINDVQFQSVRPLKSERSSRLIARLRSFSPFREFDA